MTDSAAFEWIRAGLSPPYTTILADPPWPFLWNGGKGGRRRNATKLRYSTADIADIADIAVGALAADDAHLFMWATRDVFREGQAVAVARAWGFEPCGEVIWRKPNFGTGHFPRPGHEPLLIARRGSLPFTGPRNVHSVQEWRQRYDNNGGKGHSRKPEGALEMIEAASPGPYVELFARTPRLGWDSWGWGVNDDERPTDVPTGEFL